MHSTFYDHSIEQTVLGAILCTPLLLSLAVSLTELDFHEPAHAETFRAIRRLEQNQQPVTIALVRHELMQVDRLNTTESVINLRAVCHIKVERPAFEAYLQRLIAMSQARAVYLAAKGAMVAQPGQSPRAFVDRAKSALEKAYAPRNTTKPVSMADAVTEFDALLQGVLSGESQRAVKTGLGALDWRLGGGFLPGQLWVLAARPGVGKTALALKFATSAASNGLRVAFFSLEMLRVELVQRACCEWGQVDWERIKLGTQTNEDLERLAMGQQAVSVMPLWIFDESSQSASDIRAVCQTQGPFDLVIVDYLQLMRLGNEANKSDAIGAAAKALKVLAKELGVPVVVLSQFNRLAENRPSKRPQLSDLRGSGEIEQHADGVLILHREEVYKPNDAALKGLAEIAIAKHRGGSIGMVKVGFAAQHTRFHDLEAEDNVVPMRRPEPDPYLDTVHWQEDAK